MGAFCYNIALVGVFERLKMKYQEVMGGFSGLLFLVMLVIFGLQGLNQPITPSNIVLGLMVLVGSSVLIGGGLFIVLAILFGLLHHEAAKNQNESHH